MAWGDSQNATGIIAITSERLQPEARPAQTEGQHKELAFAKMTEQEEIASYHSRVLTSPDLSFPWRLFIMLEDSLKAGFDEIVSWTVNGAAFEVHDQPKFVATILPRYFKMTKYNSFTRQLYAYGFSWIRSGEGKGGCKKHILT